MERSVEIERDEQMKKQATLHRFARRQLRHISYVPKSQPRTGHTRTNHETNTHNADTKAHTKAHTSARPTNQPATHATNDPAACPSVSHAPTSTSSNPELPPRSRTRLTPWLRRFSGAANAAGASKAGGWKRDLENASLSRNRLLDRATETVRGLAGIGTRLRV
jgi:hypothetical protein